MTPAADQTFLHWVQEELVWLPGRGMGFYPVTAAPYDEAYFEKYRGYAASPMGPAIDAVRVGMVKRHTDEGRLVDVGIGCGAFLEALHAAGRTGFGFDVNPAGVAWLQERGLWLDPYAEAVDILTLWDVLEHLHEPAPLLAQAREWVFCSLPIFDGPEDVLDSSHFRPDEHVWYWTVDGLVGWMDAQGFRCVEHGTPECEIGRESIHSFAFRRRS